MANPFGEKIKVGSAEFIRDGDNLLIRQGSDTLIVDWADFSIGPGELTQFLQPGSNSAALNRVIGGNPSSIYGSLRANGKVYLINPNGVFIGPSGRIDAGTFVASTLDVPDDEFLKSGNLTFKGTSNASVVNLGTITALDGDAYLIARTVENHGSINAPKGTVGLAGGTEVIVTPAGEEKMGVSIGSGSGKVVNKGVIAAAQAELKAAGGNLYALAIQNTGTIRATGVERKGGQVFLRANAGTIENSGTIRAKNTNGGGGRIALSAASKPAPNAASKTAVRVVNSGVIDASGTTGGTVTLGGDEVSLSDSSQVLATGTTSVGGNILIDADNVFAAGASTLVASGFSDGGSVIALAANAMEFHGAIYAAGETGFGGFAEVSGVKSLVFDGTTDLRGPSGSGTLLLDPVNFTIDATTAATITTNLLTSNVVISTAGTGTAAGDIFVNAPLLYTSANSLSLLAQRNIEANASIQNNGSGAINLVAGWDGSTGLGTPTLDFNLFTANPTSYGNNGGSISIGNGTQPVAISVGSRFGATNAAGFALALNGSDQANTASAQLGFHAETSGFNINGPIRVMLKSDLTVTGGDANFSYAQIGHGAPSADGDFAGSISITTPGTVRVTGGVNFSYAQIGHGGDGSSGNQSGAITIRTGNLNLTGGTRPHANAQVGHGDASGDAAGLRSGIIDLLATGETSLQNGPGNNAVWFIGHGTKTLAGVTNSDVTVTTGTLDYLSDTPTTQAILSQDFTDKFSRDLLGGNVTIRAMAAAGLFVDGTFNYNSPNRLTLIADTSAIINGSILNAGMGDVAVVVDNANPVRPNLNAAAELTIASTAVLQSGGAIRLYAVDPANTHLGGFIPANRRYGTWYGDSAAVAGVNFKIQPTLVLTANSSSKIYGQTITFNGTEFTYAGLQPGDSLSQVLAGVPILSSSGAVATASVAGGPYQIIFDSSLGTNFGYGLQLIPGSLTVTPASLLVTASNQTKVYGTTFAFSGSEFSAIGLKNNETIGSVDLASTASVATAGVAGSPYAITLANAHGGSFNPQNYAITYAPGTLTVTPAGLTITAANQSKVYGNAFTFTGTEFTSSGLRNGDTISSVSLTSAGNAPIAGVLASPYTINVSDAIGIGLNNYAINYVPGALTISPAPLTITAQSQSKVYGNTFTFAGTEFSTAGLRNGETVAQVDLASNGAPATATVAGSPYTITIANAHGGTFNPANYTIAYVPAQLSVTPAPLTITAANQTKVYGGTFTFTGTEFTSTGLKNGDTIATAMLTSAATSATASVPGSPYSIGIGSAAGTGLANYAITYALGTFSVTPAPLTLTASNQSKVYGTTFTFNGTEFSTNGLKNGETVGLVDLASAGAPASASITGSPYLITIGNAHGGTFDPANYSISYVPGSLSVAQAALVITAANQTKVYGSTFTFAGTEFTAVGLRSGDSISSATLTSLGTMATAGVVGSPYAITLSDAIGIGLQNYAITYVPGAFTVTPASLTIAAQNQTKVYGNTFTFAGTEFSTAGLRNGETVGLVDLASNGAPATATVAGSPYAITIANAHGGTFNPANYTIAYAPAQLSVTPAPLTITAANQTKVYGSTFTFTGTEFTSTGLKNGDAIASATLTSAATSATAGVPGSPYSISIGSAAGAGLANYAITYVPGTFSVTPAPLTLTASNQSKIYGTTLTFNGTEFSAIGLKNSETVGSVDLASIGAPALASVTASPYTITIANARGGSFNPANYTITYVSGSLSIGQATLTITAANQNKVYGDTLVFTGTELTAVGLLNGDSISIATLTSPGAIATAPVAGSPYTISISNSVGIGLQNYAITYLPGALTVTPAPLTITALNQAKVYGSTFTFGGTEFSASGLRNSDTISGVSLGSSATAPTAGVAGGPYAINVASAVGIGLANYAITYVSGQFDVTPALLTLTALDQSKTYGKMLTFSGTEFSAAGLKNGESIGFVDLASIGALSGSGVADGPYVISISNPHGGTFNAANYAISLTAGMLNVTPATLVITPLHQRKQVNKDFVFAGTEFKTLGLQNGETVGLVMLSSDGALATAPVGSYAIHASSASGGTYDPANYTVTYEDGTFDVFRRRVQPPTLPPPVVTPTSIDLTELLKMLALIEQMNESSTQGAGDLASEGPSVISSFGIQRLNLNTFFGEQLIEAGSALTIDSGGLGPPLPIGEAPSNLEGQLAEQPHSSLEEAIAEDDAKNAAKSKTTRYYDVSPGQVFNADAPGNSGFEEFAKGPAALQHATEEGIEKRLFEAATR